MNSSERRLKLIMMLQQGGAKKTAQEFADYFGVSKRTIFRDLKLLGEVNVPVTWDKYSGYGVVPGFKIPPLMFSTQELATIIVGLNFVKSQVDEQLVADAKGVEVKIKNVLPVDLKEFMHSLQEKTVVDPYLKFGLKKKKGGDWYKISSAISQKRRIQFRYNSKAGVKNTRKIDPYLLVFYKDHWNVIGFSHLRSDFRNFILDRTSEIQILDEIYEPKKNSSVEGLLFRSDGNSKKIVVEVAKPAYKRFKANLPTNKFKEIDKNSEKIKVEFFVDDLEFINTWLLQFGSEVKIEAPKELVEKRKELLTELMSNL